MPMVGEWMVSSPAGCAVRTQKEFLDKSVLHTTKSQKSHWTDTASTKEITHPGPVYSVWNLKVPAGKTTSTPGHTSVKNE